MHLIARYLSERDRKMPISAGVLAGEVWRNSLYHRRKTFATPISPSDGSITGAPWWWELCASTSLRNKLDTMNDKISSRIWVDGDNHRNAYYELLFASPRVAWRYLWWHSWHAWAPWSRCPLAVFSLPSSMHRRLVSLPAAAPAIFSGISTHSLNVCRIAFILEHRCQSDALYRAYTSSWCRNEVSARTRWRTNVLLFFLRCDS
jgi:hypothetical protein